MSPNSILGLFSVVFDDMDEDLKDFEPLKMIASKINIQHSKIFFLGIMLTLLITFVDYFAFTSVAIFGFIYPAYMTFQVKAIVIHRWFRKRICRNRESG